MAKQSHPTLTDPSTELHIASVLAAHHREKKSFVALAKAIHEANHLGEKDKQPLDRRKLKKIVDGDPDLVLSMAELHALDRYLEPLGDGLAYNSFFKRSNALQTVAAANKPVTFLLGSKSVDGSRLSLDHWDVNAFAEIQRGVSRFSRDIRFDIRDVPLHEELKEARKSAAKGKWLTLLRNGGPSLVCLGSSRATHVAEVMLAKMFGTKPFVDDPALKAKLPFHFVWNSKLKHVFPSAFRYTAEDLEAIDPSASKIVQSKGASALEMGGTVHLDRLKQRNTTESYGVCVAQRRPGGQIWFVLAGVTGPSTYAAALLASSLALPLRPKDPDSRDRSSLPYWTAVRAIVQIDSSQTSGNFLTVANKEIISGPHAWKAS